MIDACARCAAARQAELSPINHSTRPYKLFASTRLPFLIQSHSSHTQLPLHPLSLAQPWQHPLHHVSGLRPLAPTLLSIAFSKLRRHCRGLYGRACIRGRLSEPRLWLPSMQNGSPGRTHPLSLPRWQRWRQTPMWMRSTLHHPPAVTPTKPLHFCRVENMYAHHAMMATHLLT